MRNQEILSISQLNRYMKQLLERDQILHDIWVRGEISNFTHHSSGHMYFTLKDSESRVKAVMFAGSNRFLKFIPKNGTKVIARGSISVFERDGAYQLYVREMQPDGLGSLYLAYEQLKEKLEKEGLFAPERKRPLPRFPRTVGVVTSPTGAAIRDILTTLRRRYPQANVVLAPAIVQGVEAPPSIIAAIERINRHEEVDVLIVGRGGGSIEELWAFNDEGVVRAIYASRIPVISAVGHETDFTLADFVADVRAATPTAAAELAVPHHAEWRQRLKETEHRLQRSLAVWLGEQRKRWQRLSQSYVLRQPMRRVEEAQQRLDDRTYRLQQVLQHRLAWQKERYAQLTGRLSRFHLPVLITQAKREIHLLQEMLTRHMERRLQLKRAEWVQALRHLDALSPLKVMQRGYALAYKNGLLAKSAGGFAPGDEVMVRFEDGEIRAQVTDVKQEEKPHV
jgi:exodeoxyribonuclease VII large subunit